MQLLSDQVDRGPFLRRVAEEKEGTDSLQNEERILRFDGSNKKTNRVST